MYLNLFKDVKTYAASEKKVTTREHYCSISKQLVAIMLNTEDLKLRVQHGKYEW